MAAAVLEDQVQGQTLTAGARVAAAAPAATVAAAQEEEQGPLEAVPAGAVQLVAAAVALALACLRLAQAEACLGLQLS